MIARDVLLLNAFLGAALRACSSSHEALRAPAGSHARERALTARDGAAADAEALLEEAVGMNLLDGNGVRAAAGQMMEVLAAQRAGWTRLDALTRNVMRVWPTPTCPRSSG